MAGSFVQQGYGYNREEETRQGWNSPERYGQHHHAALPPVANISPQDPWSYGQQGAAGDYAPFPVNAPTVSQSPQTTSPFAFSAQRNDSFWTPHQHQHQHQQHQQPPMRSMSYGNIEHLHTGNPSFSSTYSTPAEAVRYPPPPLEYANTTMMLQQPAPQAAPVVPPPLPPPSQSFAQQPHPYMFQQEPASSSAAGPPGHAYPGSWMAAPPSFAPLQEPPESYGRRQQGHE
ncbi:hypothetical protein B0A50_04446 [Salinomyces thailandicus]|uniref:Uncharacterized protein n=1 Tax=Salinomyces thailandicus TaxID=706561 RepID=A0A4U0TYZ8_9PEZI|nr:hypothetical protein B0A50_04446 [Salinomyces thailandica]